MSPDLSYRERLGGEQPSCQKPDIHVLKLESLLHSLDVMTRKLSVDSSHLSDSEIGSQALDFPLRHEASEKLCKKIDNLQKGGSESQPFRDELTTLCLEDGVGWFDAFHELEEVYFPLARINHRLRKVVPDNRVRPLTLKTENATITRHNLSARQFLRDFFADNMTIIIGNLFIVTLASFFLGIGVMLLIHEGSFWTATYVRHSTCSLAFADCLFRLNAVHQAFIPYLRNGEGSPRVLTFFTAFIMSAVTALVAFGLLFKSLALAAIVNFVGAWGLMVGVWILLENERQM